MKKGLWFVVFSWWLGGSAQTLIPSTMREVYNFAVGDTFETQCERYNLGGTQGCNSNSIAMVIVLSRTDSPDSIKYQMKRNNYFSWNCHYQYGGTSTDSSLYTDVIILLDSSVFWDHAGHTQGCDSFCVCFTDTFYVDSSLNNRKINSHFEGCPGWAGSGVAYADGLGMISNGFGSEDYMLEQGGCGLSYYHKANGEVWGTPLSFNIISDVKDVVDHNTIHAFPNPAISSLTIQSENTFPPQTTFQLFDLRGRMVLQQELSAKTTRVELVDVSSGMYLYNVVEGKEKVGSGKVVVE
jgi:hypothetical protein